MPAIQGEMTFKQMYMQALEQCRLSWDDASELFQRARQGEEQAQEALILSVIAAVRPYATQYKHCHYYDNGRIDLDDLLQEASVFACEVLSVALVKENPGAYLFVAVCRAIRRYCRAYAGLVVKSGRAVVPSVTVSSLDAPVASAVSGEITLADVVSIPEEQAPSSCDFTPLHAAIHALPPGQRMAIVQAFGLYDVVPSDVLQPSSTLDTQKKRALVHLQRVLSEVYAHYYDPTYHPQVADILALRTIPPGIWDRLEQARCLLEAQGSQVNKQSLMGVAKVEYRYASAYLHQRSSTAYYSEREAAARLGVSDRVLAYRAASGQVPHVKQGCHRLYLKAEIDALVSGSGLAPLPCCERVEATSSLYYAPGEAQALLGITQSALSQRCTSGKLRRYCVDEIEVSDTFRRRIKGGYCFLKADIDALVSARCNVEGVA